MKYTKSILAAVLAVLLLTSCAENKITCYPGVPEWSDETVTDASMHPIKTAEATMPKDVAKECLLATKFDREINRIVITNGMTGAQYTVLEGAQLESIAAFCEPIYGTEPQSNRGYYGFYYNITLYHGPIELDHIAFMNENLPGEAAFAADTYEEVNGHEYAVRYRMQGVTTQEMLDFFGQFFPSESGYPETTANHVVGTAGNWSEVKPPQEDDYAALSLPDYRTQNPVRYADVDERGYQTDGWQDFGLSGEIRTVPVPMGMTYTYQTYSYFIRNDLTHLYPNETLPKTPAGLATWLADISKPGRRAVWMSMNAGLPSAIELISCEDLPASDGNATLGKVTYMADGQRWVFYLLCEDGTASVLAIKPNTEGDFVINFTDAIAVSYRIKSGG